MSKSTCGIISFIAKRKSEDHVMQFFRDLNEQCNNLKSHVLLMDPIPPISKIFSYIPKQERQIMENIMLNELKIKSNATNTQLNRNYCGKMGHAKSTCYRKNDFPYGHDNKGLKNSSRKVCTHCGHNSHTIYVCYMKHDFPHRHKFYIVEKKNPGKVTKTRQE
ncbi:hypothetical protein V8G54_019986 [Vigna mungo]|uniref:Uncharacterized protein n=1 Tax=Vigna mungo TaxID=3915 RepID=A0AAQ3NCT9_VIGMU